jgi:hypothetical protein
MQYKGVTQRRCYEKLLPATKEIKFISITYSIVREKVIILERILSITLENLLVGS